MGASSTPKVRPPTEAGSDRGEFPQRLDAGRRDARSAGSPGPAAPGPRGRVSAAEKWLLRRRLRRLGDPAIRVALWDGQAVDAGVEHPVALVRVHDRRTLLELALHPEMAFGDAYSDGRIELEGDLREFLEMMFSTSTPTNRSRGSLPGRLAWWLSRLPANTIGRSRRDVHHHYDIGTDFYRMWLDEQLVYTCAYFPDPSMTLDEAQRAKMDYVCRKLRLRPGETVVEAGFGWGALALHMARHYGVRVRACNLSHAQTLFARERAKAEGLASRVEFIEDDYRNLSGRFDVFVSVGMLEHVGRRYYRELGGVIDRCLKPEGRGLIHSIGRDRPMPFRGWIDRRIFPGAYPPSLREMMHVFEPFRFSVFDVENLRQHYAKTLEHWLARYQAREDRVAAMFDERFVRMWRLYLTGSIAGFTTGSLQLFQILFARPGATGCPWTRAWLYADRGSEADPPC